MTDKELKILLIKVLQAISIEKSGLEVHLSEMFGQGELMDAIKSVSGEELTMESFLSGNGTKSKAELKEIIGSIYSDVYNGGDPVEKVVVKDYLLNQRHFPEELLIDSNLDWLIGKFKQVKIDTTKMAQKPKVVKTQEESRIEISDNIKKFIGNIFKYAQNKACGNDVRFESYFPDNEIKELCKEVFGKQVNIFDIYSESEIKEDLLWQYEEGPDEEALKDYLVDEMGVSECLLEGNTIEELIKLI